MKKHICMLLILWVAGVMLTDQLFFSDSRKLAYFDTACEKSSEYIDRQVKSELIAIEYIPVSGVMEGDYYPVKLARELLVSASGFKRVQLLFGSDDLSPTRPKSKEYCYGEFIVNAERPEDLRIGLCGMINGVEHYWEHQTPSNVADYIVRYKYGDRNSYDIRSFRFMVEERESGQIIAEQNSYQLLLGDMKGSESRVWLGWGAAEGAKNCNLSSPSSFVLSAVSPVH